MVKSVLTLLFVVAAWGSAWAEPCDYYASPNGNGNGRFDNSPFKISKFFEVARPGTTLCLLDGIYQGPESMIAPGIEVPGLSGTSGRPITIRAVNDGRVTIDGEFARRPVYLRRNSWWILEGFNAKNGSSVGVIHLARSSDHNILRRIVAWDAHIDDNNSVIIHSGGSSQNLYEDCAAFGTGRKIAGAGHGSSGNTYRRCWFRWEGSTWGSPLGVTMAYNSRAATFENVLVTWSGESMPRTYVNVSPEMPMTDFQPYAPAGILAVDRIDGPAPKHADVSLRGSIVYTKATDRLPTTAIGGAPAGVFPRLWVYGVSTVRLQHIISVMDPAHPRFNDLFGISLTRRPQNCDERAERCEEPVVNNTATHITSIAGAGDAVHDDWTVSRRSAGTSLAEVQNPWAVGSGGGANLCYRWDTTTPLWPWPMNERIRAATAAAGAYTGPCPTCAGGRAERTATDVNADIETLLGPIPDSCKRS